MTPEAAESRFLEGLDLPMPEGACFMVPVADGVSLRAGLFESPVDGGKTKGTIVLGSGYSEYLEKYAETIADFLSLGYRVAMVEWRGHGCSGGRSDIRRDVLHYTDFDVNVSDFTVLMREFIMPRFPPPYFGVAHSMGGQIYLRAAVKNRGLFSAMALSAPLIGPVGSPLDVFLMKALIPVIEMLGFGHRILKSGPTDRVDGRLSENRLTTDQGRFQRNERIVEAHPHVDVAFKSLSWSLAAVRAMEDTLRKAFLPRLDIPLFVGMAEDERLVDNRATLKALEMVAGAEGKTYPGSMHELFMERDGIRRAFLADIDRHFMNAGAL